MPDKPMLFNDGAEKVYDAKKASENVVALEVEGASCSSLAVKRFESELELLEIKRVSKEAWDNCLAVRNVGGVKRRATFSDAIEKMNAKKALLEEFQVCQATLGICSLSDDNRKPTFVSPYFTAVKVPIYPTSQPMGDTGVVMEEPCKDDVVPCVVDGPVEEKNCQVSTLVEIAGPLCRTLPAAVPTTSGDNVPMPEVNLPASSDVIGCDEKDGPIGASL